MNTKPQEKMHKHIIRDRLLSGFTKVANRLRQELDNVKKQTGGGHHE
ncbi:DUF2740 family protein [Biostraticola tofi]|uniref:Uncharacterized protein DUF2740 n=1 Tax=Biostraticola tofi TaxID=466109 RepID=A0A4R3Z8L2_9GAMM|nr:DUF2740 family protein [Biostraticola tofi]TCW00420.1 uncharacterized protein DUF2740 [Biostraticola tofi]